ncbi:MAG: GTP-binding protein [Euryarchaeota archaeon]|nr:GTP-binding protein [Euryarchaeota archaeon]
MTEIVRKVCMCGDPGVGKTSLVRRFVIGKYDDEYISTLGTVVSKKTVNVESKNTNLTLMMWDISGQPEFKRIHNAAFRNSTGALAVCDVTRPETADNLREWIEAIRGAAGEDLPIVILLNKIDLVEKQEDIEDILRRVADLNCTVYSASAKTGENVEDSFMVLSNAIIERNGSARKAVADAANGLSELEKPSTMLDYMMDSFCRSLGDYELGMCIVRKQVKDLGVNFERPDKRGLDMLMERLATLTAESKGPGMAGQFRQNMMKGLERVKW